MFSPEALVLQLGYALLVAAVLAPRSASRRRCGPGRVRSARGGGPGGFDVNALMKQAQAMQSQMLEAQEKLKEETVEASAGSITSVTSPPSSTYP